MAKVNRAERGGPRPGADGSFFLWLDVSEPGNPGAGYIRLALVDDLNTTQKALTRLATWAG
ncbi:MAG TPA: hypothetical protein VGQ97_00410 [Xanthobacteraceae bacterium]|nr:hypothetical protein [Xanthobacteraceae bacterium]